MYAVRSERLRFNPSSGAPYRLSRTRIDNFLKCQRCFWLEERHGIKKPDSFPLTLNIAVDALLKKEFDLHRAKKEAHPMMATYGIDAIPFDHEKMEEWRANFTGVQFFHEPTNLSIFGAVDDIWVNTQGELHVVDYKATSKATTPTLDGDLGAQYERQMEVYQWLLRHNGFTVSNTGYFVYVNGKKDVAAFDGKLEFAVTILPCEGDDSWIEPTLTRIKTCLMDEDIPPVGDSCDYCPYREAAGKTLQKTAALKKVLSPIKPAKKIKADAEENTLSLF